jgi:hypothetical protein
MLGQSIEAEHKTGDADRALERRVKQEYACPAAIRDLPANPRVDGEASEYDKASRSVCDNPYRVGCIRRESGPQRAGKTAAIFEY